MFTCIKLDMISMGTGKIMVLLFSAEIPLRVWRYRNWKKVLKDSGILFNVNISNL